MVGAIGGSGRWGLIMLITVSYAARIVTMDGNYNIVYASENINIKIPLVDDVFTVTALVGGGGERVRTNEMGDEVWIISLDIP